MRKQIGAFALFVLVFLTMTFFRHYRGSLIPYPWVFYLVGILLFIAPAGMSNFIDTETSVEVQQSIFICQV